MPKERRLMAFQHMLNGYANAYFLDFPQLHKLANLVIFGGVFSCTY